MLSAMPSSLFPSQPRLRGLLWTLIPLALSVGATFFAPIVPSQEPEYDPTLGLPKKPYPEGFTAEKAALGKMLFFDKRLSADESTSCETCHQHKYGWSNGERFSKRVDGKVNKRNSPSLYGTWRQPYFYWDGRAATLEKNIDAAWRGHMSADPMVIADRLGSIEGYQEAFQEAFDELPTSKNIVTALAHFICTLDAGGTVFDRYTKKGEKDAWTAEARNGYAQFLTAGCITCHQPPLFSNYTFYNAGVGMDAEEPDIGRGKYDKTKIGAFKVPSLRGVAKSGPYFHDGSVETLRDAVKLMAQGGLPNKHKSPLLMDKKLNEEQISLIVAFLETLTPTEPFEPPTLPE